MVRRSDSTRIIRKEDRDKPGSIHNEGKKNIPPKLIKLFKKILEKGDDFFKACPPESEAYSLKNKFDDIPVYLIPYETYLVAMKERCESDFSKKMREMYQKEIERIPQDCNPEERERRVKRIREKYGPWLPEKCPGSCEGCEGHMAVKGTPLGYFVPKTDEEGEKICICLDRIIEEYPDKVDSIAAKVLLHELGHAIMYNESHPEYETCFEYWAEESLANKIALNYLAVASKVLKIPALYDDAEDMVKNQDSPYKFGLYLHEHNASDWASLRDGKPNISGVFADKWVDAVCDWFLGYPTVGFAELQRLFFRALGGSAMTAATSGFATWIFSASSGVSTDKAKYYLAFVTSPYIGLVFKEMVGWGYDTVADCKSSFEIRELEDRIRRKGKEQIERDFNAATYTFAHSALKQYREYLLSLGL